MNFLRLSHAHIISQISHHSEPIRGLLAPAWIAMSSPSSHQVFVANLLDVSQLWIGSLQLLQSGMGCRCLLIDIIIDRKYYLAYPRIQDLVEVGLFFHLLCF